MSMNALLRSVVCVQVAAKSAAVESLEGELLESRKRSSGSSDDVSQWEKRTGDLTTELSTLRAQYERLEHSVSVSTCHFVLNRVIM